MRHSASPRLSGNLLLASPDMPWLQQLAGLLRSAGAQVTTFSDGQEAVEQTLEHYYDLVLLDEGLPRVSAVEGAELLREMGFGNPLVLLQQPDASAAAASAQAGVICLSRALAAEDMLARLVALLPQPEPELPPAQASAGRSRIAELIAEFEAQLPATLNQISDLLLQEAWEPLQSEVHKLKGCAGSLGHPMLTELAQVLLLAIKQQDFFEACARYGEMACYVRDAVPHSGLLPG